MAPARPARAATRRCPLSDLQLRLLSGLRSSLVAVVGVCLTALALHVHAQVAAPLDAGTELAAARAATDRRDFASALPLFERLVLRAAGDADLLIEAARVFGWADRNARSAALYRQALASAPARRADIVPSLAWQTLWAGETSAALALFEEAATSRPTDRELGWALANALNAAGRHREAVARFGRWLPALIGDNKTK